jgi:metal-sulfur cluster biosynthetic enzyme
MQPNDNPATEAAPAAPVDPATFEKNPELMEWLRPVEDPEMFISIIELGLVYEAKFVESDLGPNKKAQAVMTLTSPHCPIVDVFTGNVKKRLLEYPGVEDAEVKVVFEPKWDPATMASDEVKDRLGIW